MSLASFAVQHRLKLKTDTGDGTWIILGRLGHIYEYGDRTLGVMVIPSPPRKNVWGFTRKKFLAVAMRIVQNGDCEGAAVFDPEGAEQAALAIRAIQGKRKRVVSPEQRKRLVEVGKKTRIGTALGGHFES
jgi:hypothetical protein